MKKAIIIIFVLVAVFVAFLGYSGMFAKIVLIEKKIGPFTVVYEEHIGPYSKVSGVMDKVYETLEKEFSKKCDRGIGLYYDDPEKVSQDKLRSDVGCILDNATKKEIKEIKKKLKVKEIPEQMSMTAELPIKNAITYFIGPIKVYPKMMTYAKEKGFATSYGIEIYDMKAKKIIYVMPVEKK